LLLPDKHIRLAESLIGLGGLVLENIKEAKTVDELWSKFQEVKNTKKFPAYHSFDNLILTIDFLYAIGTLAEDDNGRLRICD